MTNLGEAKCSREAEIAYASMAMITDYDCWKVDEAHVTVDSSARQPDEKCGSRQSHHQTCPAEIPAEANWPCHRALHNAIMTDKKLWPAKTRKELAPILRITSDDGTRTDPSLTFPELKD